MTERSATHEGTVIAILLFLVGALTSAVSIVAWVGPPTGGFEAFLAIVGAIVVPAALVITLAFKARTRGLRQLIAIALLLTVHGLWPALALVAGRDQAAFASAALTVLGDVHVPMVSSVLVDMSVKTAPRQTSPRPTAPVDPAVCNVNRERWTAADCRAAYEARCDSSVVATCGAKVPPEQLGDVIELAARDAKAMHASFTQHDARCDLPGSYQGGPLALRRGMKASDAELHAAALKLNDPDRDVRAAALLMFYAERQPSAVVDRQRLHDVAVDVMRGDNLLSTLTAYSSGYLTAQDNPVLIEHLLRTNAPAMLAGYLIDNPHFSDAQVAQLFPLTRLPEDASLCETLRRAELASLVCFTAGHPGRKVPGAREQIRRAAFEIDQFAERLPPAIKDNRRFHNTCRTVSAQP